VQCHGRAVGEDDAIPADEQLAVADAGDSGPDRGLGRTGWVCITVRKMLGIELPQRRDGPLCAVLRLIPRGVATKARE
jgi:hypothetical protein